MKILIIEDDERIAHVMAKGLKEEGFSVDVVHNADEGEYMVEVNPYDAIVLDLNLPDKDGLQICKKLRSDKNNTPIIMVTARTNTEDRVIGLNAGADDYLPKPFVFSELLARIRAIIRRNSTQKLPKYEIDDLVLDPVKHLVKRGENNISLTAKEFSLLEFLLSHKNEVVTRTMILEHVWDYNYDGLSNVVDVFIKTLRKKIKQAGKKTELIHTIHGVGYKIEPR
ncbi:response regulator transcription factor [Candidatus Beckwithbacteria bacterium]|nr:response regulator transcription factor [Candidatus Beckwithbacteria bacterium]